VFAIIEEDFEGFGIGSMKILLADDHTLFRDAVALYILRAEPEAEVLVARDVHGAMEIIGEQNGIDLVMLDLRMPGMDGLLGLKKIRELKPEIPVALMSGFAEEEDIKQAMALGIRGYFPKTLSGQIMLSGMRRILDGEEFVAMDHNTNNYMPSHYGGDNNKDSAASAVVPAVSVGNYKLTPRETQVLQFLARGVSNKEIARALDLQIVTVKLHVRGVCRKLGAANRTQAALKAREMGIVPNDQAAG
jgi:two-component system nitrate/nitrite response regulator NarL